MLSRVLRSKRTITVNIEIMRAFVKLRQLLTSNAELSRRLPLAGLLSHTTIVISSSSLIRSENCLTRSVVLSYTRPPALANRLRSMRKEIPMMINWTSEHTAKRQPGVTTPSGAMYVCALGLSGFNERFGQEAFLGKEAYLGQSTSIDRHNSRH
jgi:hypothetical protein